MKTLLERLREARCASWEVQSQSPRIEETDNKVSDDIRAVPVHQSVTVNEQMSQFLSLPAASLYPVSVTFDNTNAVTVPASGDGIDMLKFQRIMGHVKLGVGTPNNGTAKLQIYWTGSNTNNGTYTAFATNTAATLNTNNSEATLELRNDQIPTNNRYVKLNILVPVANAIVSATVWGSAPSYSPASQYDFSSNVSLLNRIIY